MECWELIFSGHAVQRMFERGITTDAVRQVIEAGEIITNYPEDQPFPSCLLLGWIQGNPLHVVVAKDEENQECYVITAYIPAPHLWSTDFRVRRIS
jgi:hypothetical protein